MQLKKINLIFGWVFVFFLIFIFREQLSVFYSQIKSQYFPCRSPITYKINIFDQRFGLSKEDFLIALKDAENIWEKPIGKNLFEYSTGGSLRINLIYDNRQASTEELKKMGIVLKNDKTTYDSLKSRYSSLLSQYESEKRTFETRLALFEDRKNAYEQKVASFNKKGGVSKSEYQSLNTEREYLNNEVNVLNQMQSSLNEKINEINTLARALNQLASSLNIKVDAYNTIGSSLGGEFDEGVYRSDSTGAEIDIYQFENRTKLVRVLAHELGHALGLDHNEDSKAIMYRLNNGINEKLTNTDLVALKTLCGIN